MPLDSQQIELIGRNLLIAALMADGLEVAVPQRDRGIDLLVYSDLDESGQFIARPRQLESASKRAFGYDEKYTKFPDLLLAHVWNVTAEPGVVEMFCLTQREAHSIGSAMGWDKTKSWENGQYTTSRPGAKLIGLLEQYRMRRGMWKERVVGNTG